MGTQGTKVEGRPVDEAMVEEEKEERTVPNVKRSLGNVKS